MKNYENYGVTSLESTELKKVNGGNNPYYWLGAALWSAWENFDDIKDGLNDGSSAYEDSKC